MSSPRKKGRAWRSVQISYQAPSGRLSVRSGLRHRQDDPQIGHIRARLGASPEVTPPGRSCSFNLSKQALSSGNCQL